MLGHTDSELAEYFEIVESTLNLWKLEHPSFSESLKAGRQEADGQVVQALYKSALNQDTTAAIFWLKNRQPKKWRDKQFIQNDNTNRVVMTDKDGEQINPENTDLQS